MIEFKLREDNWYDLIIDGDFKGTFPTIKKAKQFIELIPKDSIIKVEAVSPLVANQKNDEVKHKRRGRPTKVGNNDRASNL